ncbi:MAG: DUF4337 domain-containing protein [Sphingomonadales bacterium]|nr:DUF4337 domain-containing protein [Sphingomonadales bacterium]
MEVEMNAEAKDKRLNRMVAITVVVLSVFTGLCAIKDGNLVQAMQQAQSNSIDAWNEYQADKVKLHVAESTRSEIATLAAGNPAAAAEVARLDGEIAKYRAEAPMLQQQARGFSGQYDALNVHDDQFDASEALISTAISLAAVAALSESFWLLAAGWGFGAFGMFLGVCGFAKWGFHPDVLSNFLG